ncbi:MAG: hypothetical protein ACE5PV_22175 [Candidatus Poribacteria bacterium]
MSQKRIPQTTQAQTISDQRRADLDGAKRQKRRRSRFDIRRAAFATMKRRRAIVRDYHG